MRRIFIITASLLLGYSYARGTEPGIGYGIACIDITPRDSIRMNGYSNRIEPSVGISTPLQARALAIRDGRDRLALVLTLDLITIDEMLAGRIAGYAFERYQIPRERILINASHTHTGPVVHETLLEMGPLNPDDLSVIEAYTKELESNLHRVIDQALIHLDEGSWTFGLGRAEISMNRRMFGPAGVRFGNNPDAPVDTDVPVLAIRDSTRALKAVLFGYACHATTLRNSRTLSADYIGYARDYFEMAQNGVTSFFLQGCCGELNPYPRGNETWARTHALNLAGSVARVISRDMQPLGAQLECAFKTIQLEIDRIPTVEQLNDIIAADTMASSRQRQEIHFARKLRAKLENGESIPAFYSYPVQVWKFGGDLILAALGGEVTVDYSLRLKRELGGNVWISGYSNDVRGYIGSNRILLEGGYEADHSTVYYQLPSRWRMDVENQIISTVHELAASLDPVPSGQ